MTPIHQINAMEEVIVRPDGSGTITKKASRANMPDIIEPFTATELPAVRRRYLRSSAYTETLDRIEAALPVPAGWAKSRRHWDVGAWLHLRHAAWDRWANVWVRPSAISIYWTPPGVPAATHPQPEHEEVGRSRWEAAVELVGAIIGADD